MKIIMQFDPCVYKFAQLSAEKLIEALFYNVDREGAKPDIIVWETHRFLPSECENQNTDDYLQFRHRGLDMMRMDLAEPHKRGIQAYWHYRFSEVDRSWSDPGKRNAVKTAHPDWVIKTWTEEGLWNLASEELQQFKLDYIRKIMTQYDFDGICVDYLRHLPCLPVGRQWEYRDCATDFMAKLKTVMDSMNREIQVGAKLPENGKSCQIDGFDLETWCDRKLVDFVVAGSRTIDVDVRWFKQLADGNGIAVYPCWDTWHSSDAYHWQEEAFYRGTFANWLAQGADGIVGFNYISVPEEKREKWVVPGNLNRNFTDFYRQVKEAQHPETPKMYGAERRGGYPYCTGAGGTNTFAPLPLSIPNIGAASVVPLKVLEDCGGKKVQLRLVLSNAKEGKDSFLLWINGHEITRMETDFHHIDALIHWPEPQRYSGAGYCYTDHPAELLELKAEIPGKWMINGENQIAVTPIRLGFVGCADMINIERVEIRTE